MCARVSAQNISHPEMLNLRPLPFLLGLLISLSLPPILMGQDGAIDQTQVDPKWKVRVCVCIKQIPEP